ncbi:WhiB family transcriptional regulator [Glycomyces sp. YM15]|uniref:WhiB family transcriptional regulator n=1 Tax=Glycomyces sp. YM15 TaxID=2800446 RepID=UPI001963C4EB|nr:WhiB family transcriptional regulator [Glycomyces sp. YM15]
MSRPTRNYEGLKACHDADPELFYPADKPEKLSPTELEDYIRQVEEAKHHCAVCPLKEACLRAALDREEQHGIWGGTTPQERKKLRGGVEFLFDPFDEEAFDAEMAVAA